MVEGSLALRLNFLQFILTMIRPVTPILPSILFRAGSYSPQFCPILLLDGPRLCRLFIDRLVPTDLESSL